jgi:hypothetical protein
MLLPLAVAVLVILCRRENPLRLFQLRVRWLTLLWLAAVARLVRFENPHWLPAWLAFRDGTVLVVVCWIAGTAWVWVNCRAMPRRVRGALLATLLGFTMNTAVVLANSGQMPFSTRAARWAGVSDPVLGRHAVGHTSLMPGHHLSWFSDVIPVPLLAKVMSPGDVIMLIGVAALLILAPSLTGHPRRIGPGISPPILATPDPAPGRWGAKKPERPESAAG